MGDMIIRKAEDRDVVSMAELDKICFAAPWSEDSFRFEVNENPMALYIVAEIDGRLAGYAGLWLIVDEGHITNVAVHPDFRRKHIGQAIISVLLAAAEEAGAMSQTLEVRVSNEPAQKLYSKFGFKSAGVRKGYYEDNKEDAMIMWRQSDKETETEV